jgi:hypothetical protein
VLLVLSTLVPEVAVVFVLVVDELEDVPLVVSDPSAAFTSSSV